jgi:hypothetical protein
MPIYVPGKVVLRKDYIPLDASYSSVSLLLHGDGPNGSTTITDSSLTPKTTTSQSNVSVSNTQSKFGGTSLACNELSSIRYSGFAALGANDWTVELFAYRTSGTNNRSLFDTRNSDGNSEGLLVYLSGGVVTVFWSGGNRLTGTTLTLNQWVHIALTKSGSSVRLFQDGVLQTTTTTAFTGTSTDTRITSVFNAGGWGFDGFIDDLRITKGVARYTANFTPPTEPFPDRTDG